MAPFRHLTWFLLIESCTHQKEMPLDTTDDPVHSFFLTSFLPSEGYGHKNAILGMDFFGKYLPFTERTHRY